MFVGMISEGEDKLFDKWKKGMPRDLEKHFIPDGIANEAIWGENPEGNNEKKLKLIFFLKEVNGGEKWDERNYLKEYNSDRNYINSHSPTITALTQLAYGLFHHADETKWEKIESEVTDGSIIQTNVLKRIALVNVKKIAGLGTADYGKIDKFFNNKMNKNNLKEQLDLYSRNSTDQVVIICGATDWYYKQLYEGLDWKQTSRGIEYCKQDNKKIVIAFCHPLARVLQNIKYYALIDAFNEILKS